MVPSLAVPVSQTVDQLVAVIKHVDSAFAEQLIAVPRMSWPSRFPPTVLHEPQKAEQLVEVPTILFFLKQTVDNLQNKVRYSVLWSRSLTFQFQVASFKIFPQMLVRQLLLGCLKVTKSAEDVGSPSARVHARLSSSTPLLITLMSCLRPFSCSSPSRTLTFQFLVVVSLAVEVFNVFTQNKVHFSLLSS